MSRGKADEIASLVMIVEMTRDHEEARLAGLLGKARGIGAERQALAERIRATRSEATISEDPAVHLAALRWEDWAKGRSIRLSLDEAKARAAVEDQKAVLAKAMGRVSALAEIARKKRIEDQRIADRRAQTS